MLRESLEPAGMEQERNGDVAHRRSKGLYSSSAMSVDCRGVCMQLVPWGARVGTGQLRKTAIWSTEGHNIKTTVT
jgi:hypothetical protein